MKIQIMVLGTDILFDSDEGGRIMSIWWGNAGKLFGEGAMVDDERTVYEIRHGLRVAYHERTVIVVWPGTGGGNAS